jgi:hypothetical protein
LNETERRELIEQYANGPSELEQALSRAPEGMRKWRSEPSEFSVHEIIVHCADSETNSHVRIRYVLAEDNAQIVGYDPDNWATRLNYADHPLDPALQTVIAVRANTVPILQTLTDTDWAKSGTHSEHGSGYTAELWLKIYAEHCREHAEQISATIAAWRAAGEPA